MNYESDNLENEQIEISPSNPKQGGNIVKLYLNILKRKIILIVIFAILGFIPAFLISKKDVIIYAGKFEMLLEPVSTEEKLTDASTLTRSRGTVDENLLTLDYPTILRLLKSSLVLSRVAEKINEKHPDIPKESIVQKLQKNLIVERATAGKSRFDVTKIIEVRFEASNPEFAEIVLKTTADTFLEYSTNERETTLNYGLNFIDEQIPKIQSEIEIIQNKKKQIQAKYNLIDPENLGDSLFENKIKTEQDLAKTIRDLEEAKILANKLQKDLGFSAEESLIASSLNEDPERQLLITQIEKIEAEIALQSANFTDQFPVIQNLKEKRNNLIKLLDQKNRKIIQQKNLNIDELNPDVLNYQDRNRLNLIKTLIETQNQIDILSTRHDLLTNLQQGINQKLVLIPHIIEEYNELERELVLNNNILNTLSTQKETLNVEVAQKKNPWQLISEPKIPRDQNNNPIGYPPDPKKKLIVGLGAGFIIGFFIAVLLEKKANIFYEVSDIEYSFGKPILGKIKLTNISNYQQNKLSLENGKNNNNEKDNFLFHTLENFDNNSHDQSNKIIAHEIEINELERKSFHELSVNLHFQLPKNVSNSILISSLSPDDNQALVAVNLAKTISQIDKKVLLIDLNFKNPEIKSFFEKDNEEILSNLSKNLDQENQIIQPLDNYGNLAILNKPKDIKNTVSSVLSKNFDLIIYNSSFFLDNYELSLLAEKTQGILMVVRTKSTPLSSLREAVKRINDYQLNLLGFVVIN